MVSRLAHQGPDHLSGNETSGSRLSHASKSNSTPQVFPSAPQQGGSRPPGGPSPPSAPRLSPGPGLRGAAFQDALLHRPLEVGVQRPLKSKGTGWAARSSKRARAEEGREGVLPSPSRSRPGSTAPRRRRSSPRRRTQHTGAAASSPRDCLPPAPSARRRFANPSTGTSYRLPVPRRRALPRRGRVNRPAGKRAPRLGSGPGAIGASRDAHARAAGARPRAARAPPSGCPAPPRARASLTCGIRAGSGSGGRRRFTMNSLTRTVREVLKAMGSAPCFDRVCDKVTLVSAAPGKVICEMKVEEQHTNKLGTLHGGLTATLVDVISTVALMCTERGAPGVSVDLNITYMAPAKIGEDILITAHILKQGRTLAFASVDLTSKATGKLIAQGRHTKHLGN
uniref:Acyl-coenzyme A thioesterase 13 n=2 Tax=Oryctolagus cuniculus TaxID=9986 RepID=G1T641_RABIT